MRPTPRRPLRLLARALATMAVVAATVLVVAPAQAAWTSWVSVHRTHVQVCKVPLGAGEYKVKLRVDNRGAHHAHLGSLDRVAPRGSVKVRAASGRISPVKSLIWRPGDEMGVTVHETTGEAAGDMLRIGAVARC